MTKLATSVPVAFSTPSSPGELLTSITSGPPDDRSMSTPATFKPSAAAASTAVFRSASDSFTAEAVPPLCRLERNSPSMALRVMAATTLPALMTLHTGYWTFEEDEHGVTTASSQHTVIINGDNIAKVLGPDAGVPEARAFVRDALGNNSRATLGHAKAYAEARR